jgi:hypothetical protein
MPFYDVKQSAPMVRILFAPPTSVRFLAVLGRFSVKSPRMRRHFLLLSIFITGSLTCDRRRARLGGSGQSARPTPSAMLKRTLVNSQLLLIIVFKRKYATF